MQCVDISAPMGMIIVLSVAAILSVEALREGIQDVATSAAFAAWDNWGVICSLFVGIGATCALAAAVNSSLLFNMFFKPGKGAPQPRWALFRVMNWACSWAFVWSLFQLWPAVASRSAGANSFVAVDKVALFTCFLTLTYLLAFFGVSLVYTDLDASSAAADNNGKKAAAASQDGSGGSMVGSALALAYFAAAMGFVHSIDSSLLGLAATTGAAVVGAVVVMRPSNTSAEQRSFSGTGSITGLLQNKDSVLGKDAVAESMAEYDSLFEGVRGEAGAITTDESINGRREKYATMVNSFYNLVTDFYEWGWGQSFHFAPRFKGETFQESIKRIEYRLAMKMGLGPDSHALDAGCGVGGPMRNIARFSGARITGLTINEYQVRVGNQYNEAAGLPQCKLVQGDFMALPFEPATFDAAYCIESTCHAPSKTGVFKQINRALKPGGIICGLEWVMLDNYDPTNARHVAIKEGIEEGNGLPTLATPQDVVDALEAAGYEVIEHSDCNNDQHAANQIPWYDTLAGKFTLSGFRMTNVGRNCTHAMVTVLETLRIAPKGSTRVSEMLNATAIDLVDAGQMQIFTPSYLFVARKVREVEL